MSPFLHSLAVATKQTLINFGMYNIPKKSASLAYYTIFSVVPLLYLIILMGGFFLNDTEVKSELFFNVQVIFGEQMGSFIKELFLNFSLNSDSRLATAVSFVTLLIAATGVFVEIQDSINEIWSYSSKKNTGFLTLLKDRLLSFSMIVVLGFLLLVTLVINSILDVFNAKIAATFDTLSVVMIYILNMVVLLTVISTLFFIIYKVLPDVKLSNKVSWTGAVVTSVLFLMGKTLISYYLSQSMITSFFGSGGTIVVLLSWVYYSSMILYFGAALTQNLSLNSNSRHSASS